MKIQKLMLSLSCAAAAAVAMTVSCSEIDMYSVDAPEDLQERIDEIAEQNKPTDDGSGIVPVVLQATNVGANDGTSAWWTEFSDYFTIPTGKLLHLEFVNHGTGVNNWNNWNLAVTNPYERDASSYAEYFVLRSDSYGWGNADYQGALIAIDYPDLDEDGDIWNDFRAIMQGAYVTMTVDHSTEGYVFVTAVAEGTDGTVITETYNQPVSSTEDIWAFIICDGSWFEMKKAWLAPSEAKPVEDVQPASITASGYPTTIEIGSEDFWGEAVATVTYEDGVSEQVSSDDLTFTVPDLTTLGTKTILYSYSKTKMGNYGKAVAGYYTIKVVNPVASIAVTAMPAFTTYWVFDKEVDFNPAGIEVTATYVDGTTELVDNASLEFSKVSPEKSEVTVSYNNTDNTVTTTVPVTVMKGTGDLGFADCTIGWWVALSDNTVVPSGESRTVRMHLYSNNLANWNSPCVVLRRMDNSEWAVFRMDNFGWGDSYGTQTSECDWNFETLASNLNRSEIAITVTNKGDNTCDIVYDVVHANGEKHFQRYLGVSVEPDNLQFCLVSEGSYLVFHE